MSYEMMMLAHEIRKERINAILDEQQLQQIYNCTPGRQRLRQGLAHLLIYVGDTLQRCGQATAAAAESVYRPVAATQQELRLSR